MREAFDLTALAGALKGHTEYDAIRKSIEQYVGADSFRMDLQSALDSLKALQGFDDENGARRIMYGQALMTHAIVMYCRAAIEDGNGRVRMGVTKRYSQEQRKKHQNVVLLRNKSIAHFGIGDGDYGKEWIKEVAVLKLVDGQHRIVTAYQRSNYLGKLIFDLSELCSVAIETVNDALRLRLNALDSILTKTAATDSKLQALIRKVPFDPLLFFKDEGTAGAFWTGGMVRTETYALKATDGRSILPLGSPRITRL